MKTMLQVTILLTAACISQGATGTAKVEITPVNKVIQMMKGMLDKATQEKHAEQAQFAAYEQFCQDTEASKTKSIADAAAVIAVLDAELTKLDADIQDLEADISGLDGDIETYTDQSHQESVQRNEVEKPDFQAMHKNYTESINAINDATTIMKREDYDRKQAMKAPAVFMQLMKVKHMPEEARRVFANFLASTSADAIEAPEANAYEFQSGGIEGLHNILEMLEGLKKKFFNMRLELEKEEQKKQLAYENLVSLLKVQIGQCTRSKKDDMKTKAKKEATKAKKQGQHASVTKDKEEDTTYLSDLKTMCTTKASDFEKRQALRADEMEAISEAIKIIDSDDVAGSASKYLPTMLQKNRTSLAHLRSNKMNRQTEDRKHVVTYLESQASHLHSRVLSTLVHKIEQPTTEEVAGQSMKPIIEDMIQRLEAEAAAEETEKGWCDTELASSEQTRTDLTDTIDTTKAAIDAHKAEINRLAEDIAKLSKEVSELQTAMNEATTLRREERYKNEDTIQDAKDAQTAVAAAKNVLETFYTTASTATSLVQTRPASFVQSSQENNQGHKQTPPAIFDEAFKGQQAENGGIIGMLEVIDSDFARLEADTEREEADAISRYGTFMQESGDSKTEKEGIIASNSAAKQTEEGDLAHKEVDLEDSQSQFEDALNYWEKLKPTCSDENVSYEERNKQRLEEIESLQEALKILSGEDIA